MKRRITICFVGLYEQTNLGDPILAQCTEWLYQKHLSEFEVVTQRICLNKVDNNYINRPTKKDKFVKKYVNIYLFRINTGSVLNLSIAS